MQPVENDKKDNRRTKTYTLEEFKEKIKGMEKNDLRELKVELELDLSEISNQINSAKSRAAATGEYASKDWFHGANKARNVKNAQIELINIEISRRGESFFKQFYETLAKSDLGHLTESVTGPLVIKRIENLMKND